MCSGMTAERHVKLFRNGRNQAVRIPREFEFPGNEAIMRKEDGRLVIEPARRKTLLELLDSWEPIDEEFPPIDELPYEDLDI
jgi:antitoxin VapB